MRFTNNVLLVLSVVALISCDIDLPKEEPEILQYENILIFSDLSSRMNKIPNDTMVINQLVDYFLVDCVKPGIKVNDRSAIHFSRVNIFKSKCKSAKIDIGEIKSLEEKQLFVNNRSKSKNICNEITRFKENVACNYQEHDDGGLDILSLLYNEINSGNNIKKPSFIYGENDTTTINYYNHLFIFTDGYLEFSKEGDTSFYFGEPQIERVRQFCKLNKKTPEEVIKNNKDFKMRPLKSDNNKFINLYVMETYDRGLNEQKGTLKNTGDLSDNNILRTVWKIWAIESDFANIEWKQITKQSSLPKDYIRTLIVH